MALSSYMILPFDSGLNPPHSAHSCIMIILILFIFQPRYANYPRTHFHAFPCSHEGYMFHLNAHACLLCCSSCCCVFIWVPVLISQCGHSVNSIQCQWLTSDYWSILIDNAISGDIWLCHSTWFYMLIPDWIIYLSVYFHFWLHLEVEVQVATAPAPASGSSTLCILVYHDNSYFFNRNMQTSIL